MNAFLLECAVYALCGYDPKPYEPTPDESLRAHRNLIRTVKAVLLFAVLLLVLILILPLF